MDCQLAKTISCDCVRMHEYMHIQTEGVII